MTIFADEIHAYLKRIAPNALSFWCDVGSGAEPDVLDACDTLYCLKLIGRMDLVSADAPARFCTLLSGYRLAGGIGWGRAPVLNVHRTAYALAVMNLLAEHGPAVHAAAIRPEGWEIGEILDGFSRVRWPWYLVHHAWRIGHWIGGIPSILLSLWRYVPDLAAANRLPLPSVVLGNSDGLIDAGTGLFRVYRAEALQKAFRALYRFRHDPDAGDIGGIAHLHWCNYAAGRLPYKAAPALFDRTWDLLKREPFMERVPYCLDFDVVQLARTSVENSDPRAAALRTRIGQYAAALLEFYDARLNETYALHKLPGGLATLHECALADGGMVAGLEIVPVDIPKQAHWI